MINKNNKIINQVGFTLVELLVVIAIIAILAAVVAPNAFKAIDKSKAAALIEDVEAIKTASFIFYADTGVFPVGTVQGDRTYSEWNADSKNIFIDGIDGFQAMGTFSWSKPEGWDGPYLDKWPERTPFGGCYTYRYLHGDSGGSLGWAVANLRNVEDGSVFPNQNTEVVYIRFNQDADREIKRDKVVNLLKKQINSANLYIIRSGVASSDTGLIAMILR